MWQVLYISKGISCADFDENKGLNTRLSVSDIRKRNGILAKLSIKLEFAAVSISKYEKQQNTTAYNSLQLSDIRYCEQI